MKTSTKLRKKLNSRFAKKQNALDRIPAIMGNCAGGLESSDGLVYVTVDDKVISVFNNRVPNQIGVAVWIGYASEEPKLLQVLSTRSNTPAGSEAGFVGYAPSRRYEWHAKSGGQDMLHVHTRALTPLGLFMSETPVDGLELYVNLYRGFVYSGSIFRAVAQQDIDLRGQVPTTTGKAAFVLVTIDDTGAVVQTKGSEVDYSALAITDIPAIPADTVFVCGAVRVYYGQTKVMEGRTNTDFFDPRFTISLATGGGGGGAVDSVTGDGVDNTDPANPVLTFPTPLEIGAATTSTKLDDFATPDDNTDLNANITNHGLMAKLSGNATKYIGGDGLEHDLPISLNVFLTNSASDLGGGYKALSTSHPVGAEASISVSVGGTGVSVQEFASVANLFDFLSAQLAHVHIHAAKTSGTKNVVLYAKLVHRSSGGMETVIGTSNSTPNLTGSNAEYDLAISIPDTSFATGERIELNFFATASGGGSTPTVTIYLEGTTESRVELGVNAGGTFLTSLAFQRNLATDLAMANGESLVVADYVNAGAYSITLVGDASLMIIGGNVGIDRAGTAVSSATPSINTDVYDSYELTAQAVDITSMTSGLSGTPTRNQVLHIVITGTAARAIAWGTSFEGDLPTTTVTTQRLDVMLCWNVATSKWRCLTWESA